MELILIIVVLVLLFGGGGGILGSQSRLLVTVRFGQSCVPYRLGALSFAVTAWCTVRKPTKKLIIVSTEESARTSAYPSIVDELSRWPVLA